LRIDRVNLQSEISHQPLFSIAAIFASRRLAFLTSELRVQERRQQLGNQ
jgi:hypothetical protein